MSQVLFNLSDYASTEYCSVQTAPDISKLKHDMLRMSLTDIPEG